ncbi:MAG: hypothetical protein ACK5AZ_17395 [Bryobacteraceae bacterium]
MTKLPLIALLLSAAAFGQTASYTVNVHGSRYLYPGYDGYVELRATFSGTAQHLFFNNVQVPQGFTWQIFCASGDEKCWTHHSGRTYNWGGVAPVLFRLSAPSTATPMDYQVMITFEAGGEIQNVPITFSVRPTPTLPPPGTPPAPIPGLSLWQDTMLTLAAKWCKPTEAMAFGWEQQVWFYDGARVFFQVSDYTKNSQWDACAFNIASQYADYVIGSNGVIPGWRVFPHGLRMAYERSGEEKYRQAVILLANGGGFARRGGSVNDAFIRETAFVAEAYMEAEKVGAPRHKHFGRAIDFLLGHFDSLFETNNYSIHQTYTDGLAAKALIQYYQLTNDPRIPLAIKKMLDWLWTHGWNHSTKQLLINPDPPGPKCSWGCQQYNTELINLVAPAFAWYWNLTGDSNYKLRGDEMFSRALATDISYSGKAFSQNYRWSFDYVRWRSSR